MSGKDRGEAETGTAAPPAAEPVAGVTAGGEATGSEAVLVLEERKQRRAAGNQGMGPGLNQGQGPLRGGQGAVLQGGARRAGQGQGQGQGPRAGLRPARPMSEEDPDDGVRPYDGPIHPPARRARPKARHWGVVLSFFLMVVLPVGLAWWYVETRAVDRYMSTAAFSVRTESAGSAFELLGGAVNLGSSSSSDTDILYDFIQSQEMVDRINARVDLRELWAKGDPARDPVFSYHPPGTIEDMVTYWNRMVSIYNDTSTGIMDLEVQAFTPEDARLLAQMIYEESSDMINRLSDIAQEDATRFSRLELEESVERLKEAREAVTLFRNRNQIVDPAADLQSQMGILTSLQGELATTLIDLDILRQTTAANDPRIQQAERRREVIEARIAEERAKFGIGAGAASAVEDADAFADLVGEYERLSVDLRFAEQSYSAARTAFESAMSESRRQSRYLAAHVQPTLAERAEYPQVWVVVMLASLFSFLTWAILVLAAYALKDRR
jgi:capsular polysaccharide transport system permease protein